MGTASSPTGPSSDCSRAPSSKRYHRRAWPQRDSNPCLSHDHVFANVRQQLHGSIAATRHATKTRSLMFRKTRPFRSDPRHACGVFHRTVVNANWNYCQRRHAQSGDVEGLKPGRLRAVVRGRVASVPGRVASVRGSALVTVRRCTPSQTHRPSVQMLAIPLTRLRMSGGCRVDV